MTMDLEDHGKFHIAIDISVGASTQAVFCECLLWVGMPLSAENSSVNKGNET